VRPPGWPVIGWLRELPWQCLGQLDRAGEEFQAHHRRLAALPGDDDLG